MNLTTVSDVVAVLKQCTISGDLETGVRIHKHALQHTVFQSSIYISNTLLDMYAKCGDLRHAQAVFHSIVSPTVVSWNSIILGHADVGEGATALELFARMQNHGFKPDARTFVGVFKALANVGRRSSENRTGWLKLARALHSQATDSGHGGNIFVANTLVDMYAKLGSMAEAHLVFDEISDKSTVSWNVLIMGYAEVDEGNRALQLFEEMEKLGFGQNDLTYTAAIKACASSAMKDQARVIYLEKGRGIHEKLSRENRRGVDMFLGSTLVDFYSKCGSMEDARKVFDSMKFKDMVSWSTLIMGYAENGEGDKALKLFACMQEEGFQPDSQAFLGAIKACATLGSESSKAHALEKGRELQLQLGRLGCQDDILLACALIDMFAKCGSLVEAQRVFNRTRRSSVLWNSMFQAYAECGEGSLALEQFERMEEEGLSPDSRTYIALMNACASCVSRDRTFNWLQTGAELHNRAVKDGLGSDVYVGNSLLDMYVKCGSVSEAERVFTSMKKRSLVSWNTMILGHAQAGEYEQAFTLFTAMQREGFRPESRTYVGVFKACSVAAQAVISDEGTNQQAWKRKCLDRARDFHEQFARSGEPMDVFVASSVVEMYSRCGSMAEAGAVLEDFDDKHKGGKLGSMAWSTLISGYVESGEERRGLEAFHRMKERGIRAHSGAFVVCLNACGVLTSLETGRELHGELCSRGTESEPVVATSLVDFYGKCGVMEKARLVFDSMQQHGDIVTWNALLTGYAQHGHTEHVFELLNMVKHGEEAVEPNSVTFLSALAVCSHAGLVDEGARVFQSIQAPRVEHYSCMVDLLCRANKLDEALEMVRSMPAEANSRIWTTILDAANKFGNHRVGKLAFESKMKMKQHREEAATFVLMANTLRPPSISSHSSKFVNI